MVSPSKLNFKLYQGSTFKQILRWESEIKIYRTITGITATAPIVVTAPSHGMPEGWRCLITNVLGMKEVNSTSLYRQISNVSTNTFEINDVNAVGYTAYSSGGVLEYNSPVDLSGKTARMQIREKLTDTEFIQELTSASGHIVLDNTAKTITITIPATTTASYNFKSAVYSLEIVNGAEVLPLIFGNITLEKEITR